MNLHSDVFAISTDGFAGKNAGADGGLEGNFEVLAGDDFFEFLGDFAADTVRFGAMTHNRKGVNLLAGDEEVDTDEVFSAVVGEFVVEAGVARGGRFELVVKVGEEVGHRGFKVNHGAVFKVAEVGLVAAFFVDQAEDGADHLAREDNFAFDPRFANLGNGGLVGEVGGGLDFEFGAVAEGDLVVGTGVGDNEIEVKFAFETFADDVHVKQAEEADAEAEAEDGGALWLKAEGGVGEGELVDGIFEVFVLVVGDGEKASVDEGENILVAGERGGGGIFCEGDSVADFGVAGGFEVGDDVADFAGFEGGFGLHARGESTDFESLAVGVGGHHQDVVAGSKGAREDADVEDDAAVVVEVGVENKGL